MLNELPPVSEVLLRITLVPLTPLRSLVMQLMRYDHMKARGTMLQKCLSLYLISRGFTWMIATQ